MSMVGSKGTWIAALLLSAGVLGGSGLVANAAPAAQSTLTTQSAASAVQCEEDEDDENGGDEAGDQDNVQDENGADDAAEGDTDADTAEDEAAEQENSENGSEDEDASAKPGELSEGQDLLPQAKISVEEAVRAAQAEATGRLGSVELEEKAGTLVFEVTVGEQEVFVDAGDGSIVSVESVQQNDDAGCDDDAGAESGEQAAG